MADVDVVASWALDDAVEGKRPEFAGELGPEVASDQLDGLKLERLPDLEPIA
jgi:hypothetical protein